MLATTKARVKIALRMESDYTDEDDRLDQLIAAASAQVENFLCRSLEATTFTEYHTVESSNQLSLFLREPPVTSVTSLEYDSTGQFSGSESSYDSDEYILDGTTGELRWLAQPPVGFRAWKIVYAGGLAADTATLITSYPAIAQAADLQVAALYHRSADPQTEQRSLGGAVVRHSEPMGLCMAAREACAPHRLIRFEP